MFKRLYALLRQSIYLIAAAFSLAIFMLNIYYHTTVSYDEMEIAMK